MASAARALSTTSARLASPKPPPDTGGASRRHRAMAARGARVLERLRASMLVRGGSWPSSRERKASRTEWRRAISSAGRGPALCATRRQAPVQRGQPGLAGGAVGQAVDELAAVGEERVVQLDRQRFVADRPGVRLGHGHVPNASRA